MLSGTFGALIAVLSTATPTFSGGSGSEADPYLLLTCEELQAIAAAPELAAAHFALDGNIDCAPTRSWPAREGAPRGGFLPIFSDGGMYFMGSLDGRGHTISGLFIDVDGPAGIFRLFAGSVRDLALIDVDVSGSNFTGALVGQGVVGMEVSGVTVTGTVHGRSGQTGGLVGHTGAGISPAGHTPGHVIDCFADVAVLGEGFATGGLIGMADGVYVTRSAAIGDVVGAIMAGGLIGGSHPYWGPGAIVDQHTESFAAGDVTGQTQTGGFVGFTMTGIIDCFATGDVHGTGDHTGGFAGILSSPAARIFASGDVSGTRYVGALLGSFPNNTAALESLFATGAVTGSFEVGALIGSGNPDPIISDCAYWSADTALHWMGRLPGTQTSSCTRVASPTAFHSSSQAPITAFDLVDVWGQCEGSGMPFLRWTGATCIVDGDGDGVDDGSDDCPDAFNPDQADLDQDGAGDVCDADDDGDGLDDMTDNCPIVVNPGQSDVDQDGVGDVCDSVLDTAGATDYVETLAGVSASTLTALSPPPPGVNGLIAKLVGHGSVTAKVSRAVGDWRAGLIDDATYASRLDAASAQLAAYVDGVMTRIAQGRISPSDGEALLVAADEIALVIEALLTN